MGVLQGLGRALPHPVEDERAHGRPRSHSRAALAPDLLEFAKVGHRGPLDRGPVLHPVPIAHGRLPVKTPVIRNVPQENMLHLPRDLSPLRDLKRPALRRKELIKLRVAVFAQVRGRLADQPRIVTNGVSLLQTTQKYRTIQTTTAHFWACSRPTTPPRWS